MDAGSFFTRSLLKSLILICCLLSAFAHAALPPPATVQNKTVSYDALEHTRFIKEPETPWSLEYILNNVETLDWQQPGGHRPIGRTSDIYWFVLNIQNLDQHPSYVAARFVQYRAHSIEAYLIRDGELLESYRGGLSTSLANNPFSILNTHHITLEQGHDYQVLYRVDAREYLYAQHFVLNSAYALQEAVYDWYMLLGVFCGIMFFIAFCNLLAFFLLNDYLYVVMFAWIFLMSAHLMSYYASGIRYWIVDIPEYNADIIFFSFHFSEVLGVLFPILFLNTKRNSPRLHKFLVFSIVALIVIYFFVYNEPLGFASEVAELATIVLLPFLFAASIFALKNKQAYAAYYVISISVLSLYFIGLVFAGIFYSEHLHIVVELLLYVILTQLICISLAQVARVKALAVQVQEVTITSMTDELTGVPNRRAFERDLSSALAESREKHEPVSCLLLDVDFFKQYNDTLGHVAGDECLKKIASSIASSLSRVEDTLARYGGEEFAVIIPGANTVVAERVAITIMESIRQLAIPHPSSSVSEFITISIGVVSAIADDQTQPEALVDRADKQLYQAKNSGRNRYCLGSMEASADPSSRILELSNSRILES